MNFIKVKLATDLDSNNTCLINFDHVKSIYPIPEDNGIRLNFINGYSQTIIEPTYEKLCEKLVSTKPLLS